MDGNMGELDRVSKKSSKISIAWHTVCTILDREDFAEERNKILQAEELNGYDK